MPDGSSTNERLASVETEIRGLKEDFAAHREERRQDLSEAQNSRHENANRWMTIAKQNEVILTKLDAFREAQEKLESKVDTQAEKIDDRFKPLEAFRTLAGHVWATGWKIAAGGLAAFGFAVSNGDRVGKWLVAIGGIFGGSR